MLGAATLRLSEVPLVRYLLASISALAVDLGVFLVLIETHFGPAGASALAYSAGIVAHWLLSSRRVFASSVAPGGPERTKQKMLFVLSALIGLALTAAIVGAASGAGINPRLAKLVAVVVSFGATWLLRERIVFRR